MSGFRVGLSTVGSRYTVGGNPWVEGSISIASETETANSITDHIKLIALSVVNETELGIDLASIKTSTITQATETETVSDLSGIKSLAIILVNETELASSLLGTKTSSISSASELESLLSISGNKLLALGMVSEVEIANTLDPTSSLAIGIAIETELAQTFLPVLVGSGITVDVVSHGFNLGNSSSSLSVEFLEQGNGSSISYVLTLKQSEITIE